VVIGPSPSARSTRRMIGGYRNSSRNRFDLPFWHLTGIRTTFCLPPEAPIIKHAFFPLTSRMLTQNPKPRSGDQNCRSIPFGEYSSPSGGWVHAVGFSPSGNVLAFASHDASITIVYPGSNAIFNVRTSWLPFVALSWTNEENLIAAGHDCQPFLFSGSETQGGWKLVTSLDDTASASARSSGGLLTPTATGSSASGRPGRLNNEAFTRFKNADSRGTATLPSPLGAGPGAGSASTDLYTVHQNTITSVRPFTWNADGTVVESVSTSGVDGRLVIWGVPSGAGVAAVTNRIGSLHLR